MNLDDLRQKLAESRAPLSDSIEHWALPKERKFPIDSPDLLKTAAASFEDQVTNMSPSQRSVCARRIVGRAQELSVHVENSLAFKYACSRLSPHFPTFLALRKQASCHQADGDLDKLLEAARIIDARSDVNDRVEGLDKVAAALESFDREHGLQGLWDGWMPDPAYSVFGPVADPGMEIERVVKVADFEVKEADFSGVDWSRLDGKVESEVVDGLRDADDKLVVFDSLPAPHKEIIYQTLFR